MTLLGFKVYGAFSLVSKLQCPTVMSLGQGHSRAACVALRVDATHSVVFVSASITARVSPRLVAALAPRDSQLASSTSAPISAPPRLAGKRSLQEGGPLGGGAGSRGGSSACTTHRGRLAPAGHGARRERRRRAGSNRECIENYNSSLSASVRCLSTWLP